MSIQSVNPATGDVVETYEETSPKEIERILAGAQAAFAEWRNTPFTARARSMRNAAEMLKKRRTDFARLMTLEMGKPIVQAEAEVDKCAWTCEFFAEHAEGFLAEQPRETDASRSYVRFDPLGPVLAVMPWNFPFWQVFRFAAPALMAGNAAVLKHASNVPGCALAIESVFRDAGFPRGLFATVLVGASATRSRATPRLGRKRASTCATRCTARSRNPSAAAPACSWVARFLPGRGHSIRRRCSARCPRAWRPSTRRRSARSPQSSGPRTTPTRCGWRTAHSSAWARRCGRRIGRGPSAWPRRSSRARCS